MVITMIIMVGRIWQRRRPAVFEKTVFETHSNIQNSLCELSRGAGLTLFVCERMSRVIIAFDRNLSTLSFVIAIAVHDDASISEGHQNGTPTVNMRTVENER